MASPSSSSVESAAPASSTEASLMTLTDPTVMFAVGVVAVTAVCVELPGTAKPGHGPIHRHPGAVSGLTTFPEPDVLTCYDTFQVACKRYRDQKALGTRKLIRMHKELQVVHGEKKTMLYPELGPYEWLTFKELHTRTENFSSGLIALGLKPKDFLAIFEETRLEWTIAARASFNQNFALFTVYANLGSDALDYALNQGEITHIVANASSAKLLATLAKCVKTLKVFICVDTISETDRKACEAAGVRVVLFTEVEELGAAKPVPHNPPMPQDLACIMYTSGSTGVPKGVMISHENFVSLQSSIDNYVALDSKNDRILHFLPLAHSLSFMLETVLLYRGVPLYYGNPRTIASIGVRNCKGDLLECRPTYFVGVPAILEKLKHAVMMKVAAKGTIVRTLFATALSRQIANVKNGTSSAIWDKIFAGVRREIGLDAVKLIFTGSAPFSGDIHNWVRAVFNCPVTQGYGLTETCSGATLQHIHDVSTEVAGAPSTCAEIKLVDVSDLGYRVTDSPPRGEIWVRGPTVSLGYYKAQDKTDEVYFKDPDSPYRWFATGDVAMWLPDGNLKLIDRKKHLIKPPHGEYIAIEKLEAVYRNCPFVSFLMVYVDGQHYDCVAIVVPNVPMLTTWAKQNNILSADDYFTLVKDPKVIAKVLQELQAVGRDRNLRSIEMIRAIHITPEEWTPQNNRLTAAMKLNRNAVIKDFQTEIDALYKSLSK